MFPDTTESDVADLLGKSIAVDSYDNVYAVRWRGIYDEDSNVKSDHVLYVFDENYNIKFLSVLNFLDGEKRKHVKIAVNKKQNLIMCQENQEYVTDNTGKLISQFKRDDDSVRSLDISNNNDIMIALHYSSAVEMYSTEGNLKSVIKVPEGHKVRQVAFHHGIGKIIGLTNVRKLDSLFFLVYSETGEQENSVVLAKGSCQKASNVKSHLDGAFAVQVGGSITLI